MARPSVSVRSWTGVGHRRLGLRCKGCPWPWWETHRMEKFAAAGAGFLLAVLLFDLMFDIQVLRQKANEVPEPVLASISAYYKRVTTDASPMGRLVALVMVATIASTVAEVVGNHGPHWAGVVIARFCHLCRGSRRWSNRTESGPTRYTAGSALCPECIGSLDLAGSPGVPCGYCGIACRAAHLGEVT